MNPMRVINIASGDEGTELRANPVAVENNGLRLIKMTTSESQDKLKTAPANFCQAVILKP
jgi:hypothetical protein